MKLPSPPCVCPLRFPPSYACRASQQASVLQAASPVHCSEVHPYQVWTVRFRCFFGWPFITSHLAQCLAFNPFTSSWSESFDCFARGTIGLFRKVFPTMFLSWRWNRWIRIVEVVGSFTNRFSWISHQRSSHLLLKLSACHFAHRIIELVENVGIQNSCF